MHCTTHADGIGNCILKLRITAGEKNSSLQKKNFFIVVMECLAISSHLTFNKMNVK